jgi:myo-inositol 2-dehydrogenase/D-chiro-inositol 1-dehydrogenase
LERIVERYRIGVIGYGRVGPGHVESIKRNQRFDLAWICDKDPERRRAAQSDHPETLVTANPDDIYNDAALDAVVLLTRRTERPELIRKALGRGLHVMAEKPLGSGPKDEPALLADIEKTDRIVAVNLYNRNAWYHGEAKAFVRKGEIGKLAVVRVCHIFPGPLPTKGEDCPDPPLPDCAMHYIDIARFHAGSTYAEWTVRAACVWDEPADKPWYVSIHGRFENNVLFELTNSYAYANGSRERANRTYTDLIGTHGAVRIDVDAWGDAVLDAFGIHESIHLRKPYGDKYYSVLYERFAHAMDTGEYGDLGNARDAVECSLVAYKMLESAARSAPRAIGVWEDLEDARRRRAQRDGVIKC